MKLGGEARVGLGGEARVGSGHRVRVRLGGEAGRPGLRCQPRGFSSVGRLRYFSRTGASWVMVPSSTLSR